MKKIFTLLTAILLLTAAAPLSANATEASSYSQAQEEQWNPDYTDYHTMTDSKLKRLVAQDDSLAAFVLACRCMDDDPETGIDYLSKSALLGNADAMYFLGSTYLEMDDIDQEGIDLAIGLLLEAAAMGQEDAINYINSILEDE